MVDVFLMEFFFFGRCRLFAQRMLLIISVFFIFLWFILYSVLKKTDLGIDIGVDIFFLKNQKIYVCQIFIGIQKVLYEL